MRITTGDLGDQRIVELVQVHVRTAHAQTAPGSAHALDSSGLQSPGIEFFAAWDGEELLGFGALNKLSPDHGEVKSMHVAQSSRRRGAGTALLTYLIGRAHEKGVRRLSLETGSRDYFRPAHALYRKYGFVECAPLGDYQPDRNSIFMTLDIGPSATPQAAIPILRLPNQSTQR